MSHIIRYKVHSHRDPFILPDHFMAQAKTACLEYDIRFKPGFLAFSDNPIVDLELTAFYIKRLILQILYDNRTFPAERMRLINQKFHRKGLQLQYVIQSFIHGARENATFPSPA